MSAPEADPFAATRMSLGEHLAELRSLLIKGLLAVAVAFAVGWAFQERITELVLRPYDRSMDMLERYWVEEAERLVAEPPGRPRTDFFVTADPSDRRLLGLDRRLQWIKPTEPFLFILRICGYFALFAGAPVLLWQLWQFVAAGLYSRERRAVRFYFPFSLGLFLIGVLFGYFLLVPYAMYYLNRSVSLEFGTPKITVESFLSFLSSLCLAFGAVFQLPLIVSFLGGAGLVEPGSFVKYRGHFIVGAFIVAGVLTPPDPYTQLMLGIPLVLLYEVGIICARIAARRRRSAA